MVNAMVDVIENDALHYRNPCEAIQKLTALFSRERQTAEAKKLLQKALQ
jgi:hypothetical protein